MKKVKKILLTSLVVSCLFSFGVFVRYAYANVGRYLGDWVEVKNLLINDYLLTDQGWGKILSKEYKAEPAKVYNLSVSEPNTFIADSVVAHNKGECKIFVQAFSPKDMSHAVCIGDSCDELSDGVICQNPGDGIVLMAKYLSTTCSFPQSVEWKIYSLSGTEVYSAESTLASQPLSYFPFFSHTARICQKNNPITGGCMEWSNWQLAEGDYIWTVTVSGSGASYTSSALFHQDCLPDEVPCDAPPAVTVGDQKQCLAGNTPTTWALTFAAHAAECDSFDLQVDTNGDNVPENTVTGLSGTSYNYNHTTPNTNNASITGASAYRIRFRTHKNGVYSAWVQDEYGTDISAPSCDFTIHNDPTRTLTCSGGAVTRTSSSYVDLYYTGVNTGCSPVSRSKASLTSGGGTYAAYTNQCYFQNLDISATTGTFSVYSRFRDSLNRESVQCAETLQHPIPANGTLTLGIWNDTNGDGLYLSEELLPVSRILQVRYRLTSTSTWTSLSVTNSRTLTLVPGNYEMRIDYNSTCPNYAQASRGAASNYGIQLNGAATSYTSVGTNYGTRLFSISSSTATTLYMGAWEPFSKHAISGSVVVDQDGNLATTADRSAYVDAQSPALKVFATQAYTAPVSATYTNTGTVNSSGTYNTNANVTAYLCFSEPIDNFGFTSGTLDSTYSILQSPNDGQPLSTTLRKGSEGGFFGCDQGSTHYFRVTALIGAVETPYSSNQVMHNFSYDGYISLSWTAVPGASAYRVYEGTTSNFTSGRYLQSATNSLNHSCTGTLALAAPIHPTTPGLLIEASPVAPVYGRGTITNQNFILGRNLPNWIQVASGDSFSSNVDITVPSSQSFATGIVFAVNATLQCSPGSVSTTFGNGLASYGTYNTGGENENWPFAWEFGDDTSSFTDASSSNYSNLTSGTWYTDSAAHFQTIVSNPGTYTVSREGISGRGVAYIYVNGNVTINHSFLKSAAGTSQGLVVFINGNLTITEAVGGLATDLQALFVVNGNVIIDGNTSMTYSTGQLDIRGGFYIANLVSSTGNLTINRGLVSSDRETHPVLRITGDPSYFMFEDDSSFINPVILWEEI